MRILLRHSALILALLAGIMAGCLQGPTPATHRVAVVTEYAGDDEANASERAINGTIRVIVINRTAWGSDNGSADVETRAENGSARYGTHARQGKLLTPPPPNSEIPGEKYLLGLGPDGEKRFRVPVDPPIMVKVEVSGTAPSEGGCENRRYSGEWIKVNVTEDLTVTAPFDVHCYDRVT